MRVSQKSMTDFATENAIIDYGDEDPTYLPEPSANDEQQSTVLRSNRINFSDLFKQMSTINGGIRTAKSTTPNISIIAAAHRCNLEEGNEDENSMDATTATTTSTSTTSIIECDSGNSSMSSSSPPSTPQPSTSTTTTTTIQNDDGFPNDRCSQTIAREERFLNHYGLDEYVYDSDLNATVIYSRTTKKRYVWPCNLAPLTAKLLNEEFNDIGHTLAIDYTCTYRRKFSLDLDCICRRYTHTKKHLDERNVQIIVDNIQNMFNRLFGVQIESMIWQSQGKNEHNCGFHLYTNCDISLPTHLFIAHLLRSQLNKTNSCDSVIIEVPTFMPLPFSAKESFKPYISLLPHYGTNESISLSTTTTTTTTRNSFSRVFNNGYIEMFEYVQQATGNILGYLERLDGDKINVCLKLTSLQTSTAVQQTRETQPTQFKGILRIVIDNACNQYMNQLDEYISGKIELYNNNGVNEIFGTTETSSSSSIEPVVSAEQNEQLLDVLIRLTRNCTDNIVVNRHIEDFIVMFNRRMGFAESETTSMYYIRMVCEDFGSMYMQPLIVAFYKYMSEHFQNIKCQDFTILMKYLVFVTVIDRKPVLRVFLERFEKSTVDAYISNYTDIIDYLRFVIVNRVSPYATLDEAIDQVMLTRMRGKTSEMIFQEQRTLTKDKLVASVTEMLHTFFSVLKRFRVIYFDESSERYYVNVDYYYKSVKPLTTNELPRCLFKWVCINATTSPTLMNFLKYNLCEYCWKYGKRPSPRFMFSTMGGVFNAATGTYTAHTPLLTFVKYRHFWIWNWYTGNHSVTDGGIERPVMYEKQNEDIYRMTEETCEILSDLKSVINKLYLHFMVEPTILHMRYSYNIDEHRIYKFVTIMSKHPSFETIYQLIDYFPIDPKFVFLIWYFYRTQSNLNVILSYGKLRDRIFSYDDVEREDWLRRFGSLYTTIKYDPNPNLTQLERITSFIASAASPIRNGAANHNSATVQRDPAINVEKIFESNNADYEECLTSPDSDYARVTLNKNEMFLFNLVALCMIRCRSFNDLTHAFRVNILPRPLRRIDEYEDFNKRNNVTLANAIYAKERAYTKVFGDITSRFKQSLVDKIFSLGISTNFEYEKTCTLLNSMTLLNVNYNPCKKMIILYGAGGVGKSHICDDLQAICSPSIFRNTNFEKMHERYQGLASTNNIIIINEASTFQVGLLKSITGNDPSSAMRFFSQENEMHYDQSTIYGATNSYVNLTHGIVERTAIERIHAVTLTGISCLESEKNGFRFRMMTDGRYFRGLVSKDDSGPRTLTWLIFCQYLLKRDNGMCPYLDTDTEDCRNYKMNVFYNTSSTFKMLVDSGLIEKEGFFISSKKLLNIVRKSLDKNDREKFIEFKQKFQQLYSIDFRNTEYVPNFQQIGLIQHITSNMEAHYQKGSVITLDDISERVAIYNMTGDDRSVDRDNAESFFERNYESYFNYDTRRYEDLAFTREAFTEYLNNSHGTNNNASSSTTNFDEHETTTINETDHVMNYID